MFQNNPNRSSCHVDRDSIGKCLAFFLASTNQACRHEGRNNELGMLRADKAWNIQLRQCVLCHCRVFGCSCWDSGSRSRDKYAKQLLILWQRTAIYALDHLKNQRKALLRKNVWTCATLERWTFQNCLNLPRTKSSRTVPGPQIKEMTCG